MTVAELITSLQSMPPEYRVQGFMQGVEIEDFESDIFLVERVPEMKVVDLWLDEPKPIREIIDRPVRL